MDFLNFIIGLLNKVYRLDEFIRVWLTPISLQLNILYSKTKVLRDTFFFDTLDADGCKYFEKLLGLPIRETDTLENRRAIIQARWLSNNHNDLALIQSICDSWKNGETEANFINGKITLKFIGSYGVPADLDSLKKAIDLVKPAHLPYELLYKYLLKKEIHHVLTKSEMETYRKNQYCKVGEE